MSEENLEAVRRGAAAYNRRDLDALMEDWASDAVLDWTNSRGFDANVYQGHAQIVSFWERFFRAFEDVRFEVVDLQEVEEGVLVAENVAHLRGRDGIQVQARSAYLVTRRGGVTTSLTLYQTKQEALEAAGLSE